MMSAQKCFDTRHIVMYAKAASFSLQTKVQVVPDVIKAELTNKYKYETAYAFLFAIPAAFKNNKSRCLFCGNPKYFSSYSSAEF